MCTTYRLTDAVSGCRATSIEQVNRIRLWTAVGAAAPAIVCALIGIIHPTQLTEGTAGLWQGIHIALIPLFPLIGLGPWLIARRVDRRLGWLGALFGYGYATFYTSLDLLAGVAAGTVQLAGFDEAKGPLYAIARILAMVGIVSLIAGVVTASIAAILRAGLVAVPGAVLALAGAILHYYGHIYLGYGTLSMLLLAAGMVILAFAATRDDRAIPAWALPVAARS